MNNNSLLKRIVRLFLRIFLRISRFTSMMIDRLLFSKRFASLVSLLIALLLFASVTVANNQATSLRYNYEKKDVEVVANYDKELYDVTGIPQSVNISASGKQFDIQAIDTQTALQAVLDLSNLTEGTHQVKIGTIGLSPNLAVYMSPESATVTIQKKVSKKFKVVSDFINEDTLEPQFVLSAPLLDLDEVEIKSSPEKLDQISVVRALIDVKNQNESFKSTAKIAAYNQQGELMKDVIITPSEISAEVAITSPSRQVELQVIPVGSIPGNKMIDSIDFDTKLVTLYGPQEILNQTSKIDVNINGETLIQNPTILKHTLIAPTGIKKMSVDSVSLTINLADKQTKKIEGFQVFLENNTNGYKVVKPDGTNLVVDLVVEGTQKRLDGIDLSRLVVSLDMSGLKPGLQTVKLNVKSQDPLINTKLSQDTLEIEIMEKGE